MTSPSPRPLRRALEALAALAAFTLATGAPAQPRPGFAMLGHIEALSVDNAADPLSAGRLTINGIPVRLPRNLFITMPGQYLTPADLFRGRHPGTVPALAPVQASSGLALADPPAQRAPIATEAEVLGNMVGGEYVAGVVRLSQQGLNAGQGFIRAIDHAKAELLVGPDAGGPPVARVRINDPAGAYGRRNRDKAGGDAFDDRFGADPGNAAIVANTGFPMCIPRVAPPAVDPECPLANRAPAGGAFAASEGRRYTCGPVAAEPTAPSHAPCDARRPAPLQVGDFITYAGMLTEEAPGSGSFFHAAHAIEALLGIYTSPGRNPAYVFTEVSIVGTLGEPWPGIDQEETSRFRIVGFTTDPSRRVKVYALDNPGTPAQPSPLPADADAGPGERLLAALQPSPTAQIGRVRITLDAKSNFLPVTRDIVARIEGHPVDATTAGGLAQGRFTAPVSEYIGPENTRFGRPRAPVAVPFENFCFLSRGGEPLSTLGRNGPAIGPLAPFPDSGRGLAAQVRADGRPACP